jgi:hypothetical protein
MRLTVRTLAARFRASMSSSSLSGRPSDAIRSRSASVGRFDDDCSITSAGSREWLISSVLSWLKEARARP